MISEADHSPSRPVVITIFTQIVRPSFCPSVYPSVRPKISKSSDNHCRPGLWAGRVDHWWLLSCLVEPDFALVMQSQCPEHKTIFTHFFGIYDLSQYEGQTRAMAIFGERNPRGENRIFFQLASNSKFQMYLRLMKSYDLKCYCADVISMDHLKIARIYKFRTCAEA